MHYASALYLAAPHSDLQRGIDAFFHRLRSDPTRTIILFVVFGLVFYGLNKYNKAWIAALGALGAGWLSWYVYNAFTGEKTPLFADTNNWHNFKGAVFGSNWGIFALFIGVVLAVTAARSLKQGAVTKAVAAISVFIATILVYIIIRGFVT